MCVCVCVCVRVRCHIDRLIFVLEESDDNEIYGLEVGARGCAWCQLYLFSSEMRLRALVVAD